MDRETWELCSDPRGCCIPRIYGWCSNYTPYLTPAPPFWAGWSQQTPAEAELGVSLLHRAKQGAGTRLGPAWSS